MRKEKGFTLIELMIVIAIIAIIAAIAIPSLLSSQRSANERSASGSLKNVATMEFDFRSNDRDGSGVNDFFTTDVAGLYGFELNGLPIKLIGLDVARADNDNAATYATVGTAQAKAGYHYCALDGHDDGTDYTNGGTGRHVTRFGLAAYPNAYGVTGNLAFVVDESNTMWKQDSNTLGVADGGGEPAISFPDDPPADGYSTMD